MFKTKQRSIPKGLSGIFDYSFISESSHPVPGLIDGLVINTVVESSKDSLVIHFETNNEDICNKIDNNFANVLVLLEQTGLFKDKKLLYHK